MMSLRIPIIPMASTFVGSKKTLDYKAICVFAATGFFLDQDTYYTEQKVLKAGFDYEIKTIQSYQINDISNGIIPQRKDHFLKL